MAATRILADGAPILAAAILGRRGGSVWSRHQHSQERDTQRTPIATIGDRWCTARLQPYAAPTARTLHVPHRNVTSWPLPAAPPHFTDSLRALSSSE